MVGMVGGGQLARMTAGAAARLGVSLSVLDPDPGCPAAVGASVVVADVDDLTALVAFGRGVDVVTFDHERIPVELVEALEAEGVAVAPGSASCRFAFDKADSRARLDDLGFPVPRFEIVSDAAGIVGFGDRYGWPVMAKAARGGYDGRGVSVVEPGDEAAAAALLGPVIVVEELVDFDQELAIMVARRPNGDSVTYPLVSTVQSEGMCVEVVCPAAVPAAVADAARRLAVELADAVELVGVMAIELFLVDDELLVNELATRPHNTGHHTIEACVTSQFEQHLRAILDLPLGSTELRAPAAAMRNVVGSPESHEPTERLAEALEVTGAHVHLYGKQPRAGRKLGHVTALGATVDEARSVAEHAADRLNGTASPVGERS